MANTELPEFRPGMKFNSNSARKWQALTDGVRSLLDRGTGDGLNRLPNGEIYAEQQPTGGVLIRRAKIGGYSGSIGFTGRLVSGAGSDLVESDIIFRTRRHPHGDPIQTCLPNLEDCFGSTDPDCWPEVIGFQQTVGASVEIVWYIRDPFIGTCA